MVLKVLWVYVVSILMLGSFGCTPIVHHMFCTKSGSQQRLYPEAREEPVLGIVTLTIQPIQLAIISDISKCNLGKKQDNGNGFSLCRERPILEIVTLTMQRAIIIDMTRNTDPIKCNICKKQDNGNGFGLCKEDHKVCLACWEEEVYNRSLSVQPYRCFICKKEESIACKTIDSFIQACRQGDLDFIKSSSIPLEKLIICAMLIGKYPFNECVESDSFEVSDHFLSLDFWSSRLLNITNSEFMFSPLYKAVEHNNLPLAKKLLEKGVDPNQQFGLDLKTPLHVAIFNLAIGIVELLIKHKADVNCISNFKRTPLHDAVTKKSFQMVQLLLKKKAFIEQEDVNGQTVLYTAIEQADVDIVRLLLNNGASVDHRDSKGKTPLAYAYYWKDQLLPLESPHKKETNSLFRTKKRGGAVLPSEFPTSYRERKPCSEAKDIVELMHLPNKRRQVCDLLIQYGAYIIEE